MRHVGHVMRSQSANVSWMTVYDSLYLSLAITSRLVASFKSHIKLWTTEAIL